MIKFFGSDLAKKYWRFSNFANLPIVIDGVEYQTSEHYFQAAKFFKSDPEYAQLITKAETPLAAKKLGKSRKHPIDDRWDSLIERDLLFKDIIMEKALKAKAEQHPEFLNDLLATGNAEIVEASPYDSYWGSGKSGKGKNMLGKLLVELRDSYSTKDKDGTIPNNKDNTSKISTDINSQDSSYRKGSNDKELNRCIAVTQKGLQCKKRATNNGFCSIHNK